MCGSFNSTIRIIRCFFPPICRRCFMYNAPKASSPADFRIRRLLTESIDHVYGTMALKKTIPSKQSFRNLILLQTGIAFIVFCTLSLISQAEYSVFVLVAIMGIVLPLVWGWYFRNWAEMGFTRDNRGSALRWGLVAGILTGMLGLLVLPGCVLPADLLLQLSMGVPVWAFLVVPFQELFSAVGCNPGWRTHLGNVVVY